MTGKKLSSIFFCALGVLLFAGCGGEESKESLLESAEEYFQDGKYEEAKIEFLKVLRKDQGDPVAIARLGHIWREQGALRQAIPFLLECKQLAPDDLENRVGLAEVMFALGGRTQAREELLEILEASPDLGRALTLLADTSTTPEQLAETETVLNAASDPEHAAVLTSKAILSLRKKDLAAADALLTRAVENDPRLSTAWNVKSALHAMRRELPEAEEALKKAADVSIPRSPLRVKYARILLGMGKEKEADAYLAKLTSTTRDHLPAWRLRAELALSRKDYDLVAKHLKDIFGTNPQDLDGLLIQSQLWLAQGETEKALDRVKSLRDAFPDLPAIELQLARAYLLASNPSLADAALDRAIALNPLFDAAILLRARLNLRQGGADDVIDAMRSYLGRRPDDFQGQLLLADAYRANAQLIEAESVLAAQTAKGGEDYRPYLFLGIVQRQLNKLVEARAQFEKAQELAPDNLLITYQLTTLDISSEDFQKASARVGEQLARNPQSPGAHFLKARILAEQQQWDQSELALKEAINLKPDFLAAYDLMTRVLVEAGKLESAARQLESYLSENPDTLSALMQLAMVRQQMEQYEQARDGYERLLKLDANFAPALNNLAWIYSEVLDNPKRAIDLAQRARELPLQAAVAGSIADTLGWIYYRQGEWKLALSNLQEAVAQLQDNPVIQYHLGMAAYQMNQRDLARDALQKAVASQEDFDGKEEARQRLALLSGEGTGDSSVASLLDQLKANPDDLIVRSALGAAYEREMQFLEAAAEYEEILKINPQLANVETRLAVLYAGPLQDPKKALSHARQARELAPRDATIAATLGSVAFQARNYDWSLSLLQEAVRGGLTGSEIDHDLAWASYSQGLVSPAREAMQRAKAADPVGKGARYDHFLQLTDPAVVDLAALEPVVKELLGENANYVPALMVQAALDLAANRVPESIAGYRKALAEFPAFVPATRGLALAYARDPATLQEAQRLALVARETLSDDPELASVLAAANFQDGNSSYVIDLLNEVASQRGLSSVELFQLGMSQALLNQIEKARQSLQKALAADLPAAEAEKAKNWLSANKGN